MPPHEPRIWRAEGVAPARGVHAANSPALDVSWSVALSRGVQARCPVCGGSRIFDGYLSLRSACARCGTQLSELPADDAPPWLTMFIVLHLVIGMVMLLGRTTTLETTSTLLLVLPVAALLCLMLLRPVKGVVVALLLKLDVTHGVGS